MILLASSIIIIFPTLPFLANSSILFKNKIRKKNFDKKISDFVAYRLPIGSLNKNVQLAILYFLEFLWSYE